MQRRTFVLILTVILIIKLVVFLMTKPTSYKELEVNRIAINVSTNKVSLWNMSENVERKEVRTIKIAFYHPFHTGLRTQMKRVRMSECEYNNCHVRFTGTTSGFVDAHAVLFQGNHMPGVTPKRRDPDQVFVFIDVEAPQYLHVTNLLNPKWRNFFNWTMTYRLDSDIPNTYGSIVKLPGFPQAYGDMLSSSNTTQTKLVGTINTALQESAPSGIVGKGYRTIFRQKTKLASWLVSHCITASKREKYVKMMQKHIHIDVFGKCTTKVCKKNSEECRRSIIRNYFFYLSFENSLCNDYVTEKEFNWFNEDIITVVRGARNYRNHLPEGTYIDAGDFKSPAQLAYFLKDLSRDEERYIAYLKRKDYFRSLPKQRVSQKAYCELCKRLNNLNDYRKSYKDIHSWLRKDICIQPTDIY